MKFDKLSNRAPALIEANAGKSDIVPRLKIEKIQEHVLKSVTRKLGDCYSHVLDVNFLSSVLNV